MSVTPFARVSRFSLNTGLAARKLRPSRIAQVRQPRKFPSTRAFTGLSISLNSTSLSTALTAAGGEPSATSVRTMVCGKSWLISRATKAALTVPARYSSKVSTDLRPSRPLSCRLVMADMTSSITNSGATALSMPTNSCPSRPSDSARPGNSTPSRAPITTPSMICGTRPSCSGFIGDSLVDSFAPGARTATAMRARQTPSDIKVA